MLKGVVTQLHGEYTAKCVVLATGTNLGGKIFVGDAWYASGPDGMHAANALTDSLKAAGLPLRRFKTGTPARVHRRSIDFSKLECQPGDPDSELQPFSFLTDAPMHNKVECWIAYTNPETHKIILDNIQRSPLYGGMIEGVGPRYCPSIEDKVVRFSGKDRHPLFVEPCGENTEEMYLQGASSSLPEDVQNAFYHSIKGFEHLEIMRPAYAIEYDCVDPTSLEATLESKVVRGLYGAGQFNGTSGYEEAAAQGLLAGLNAARNALGLEQLVLPRQLAVGAYYQTGRWAVGVDYVFQNWGGRNSGYEMTGTSGSGENKTEYKVAYTNTSTIKMGVEYTPNRYDARHFLKRWSYRAGFRYGAYNQTFNGDKLAQYAVTAGIGIPVRRGAFSAIDIGVEYGRRGYNIADRLGLVRQQYFKFAIGFTLFAGQMENGEYWFMRSKFD